ncbi:MAG: dethiobiotin synthase [Firmicutes bacterium]|nr:dethiobiotin synthase [Bacillota bacterium]
MSKSIYITATGTEIGKTYISGQILKTMREAGKNVGYFKPGLSGADANGETDLGYAVRIGESAGNGKIPSACPYIYKTAVSPHLAGQIEKNPIDLDVVLKAYRQVADKSDYVVIEGAGGAVCPITFKGNKLIMLTDVVEALFKPAKPKTIVVTSCKLGTINMTYLTVEFLKSKGFDVKGIIFNQYKNGIMEDDNIKMIECLTGLPTLDKVADGGSLNIDVAKLWS